jgi:cytochrome bd-type quinol oxidase subunit 2
MTQMVMEIKMLRDRKLIFQLACGGLMGCLAGYSVAALLGVKTTGTLSSDQVIVGGIGLVYLMMGLIVGFGLAFPKLGSKILNVEDAEEISDQKRILTGSAVGMAVLGSALLILPMARPDGAITPLVGFGGLLAALTILMVISIRDWKHYDELILQLSRDAGNFAFGGTGLFLLIWASASWAGLASVPTPLALVAIVSGGFLLATFVAGARLGLLRPR